MSWFSNLFTNETVLLAAQQESAFLERNQRDPYEAVRTKIRSGAVSEQIAIIRDLVLKLPVSSTHQSNYLYTNGVRNTGRSLGDGVGRTHPWPHRRKIHNQLNLLRNTMGNIDVDRSDMKTLFHIIDVCNDTLPAIFRELEIQIGQNNMKPEAALLGKMEKVVEELLAEIALLPTTRSILTLETPSNMADGKNFPIIEAYSEHSELYSALLALKEDWDKAALLPLSAEDDYVIERVGNSYLPDALLLFDRFCKRTGSTNSGKALAIVKEQVDLIHQQVAFVLEQHEEDSFDLMETHTAFLKMKTSRLGADTRKGLSITPDESPEG